MELVELMGPSSLHLNVSKCQTYVIDGSPRANTWQARSDLLSSHGGSMVSAPLIESVIIVLAAD